MKTIACKFLGLMDHGQIVLWNLLEDMDFLHLMGSTVSTLTLNKAGFMPPHEEQENACVALLQDPDVLPCIKAEVLGIPMDDTEANTMQAPHYPLDISKPAPINGASYLHQQIWIRDWFHTIKGRYPSDEFVAWCCETMSKGGAILVTHQSK